MPRVRLTKRIVNATQPAAQDRFLWDTEVRGFGLKITPAGRRIFVLQARLDGRVRRFTIGRHGAPWTPDQARTEAVRLLGRIANGHDPGAEKKERRHDVNIAELCRIYLAEGCAHKKPRTRELEASLLRRHIRPLLGDKRVRGLVRADVEKLLIAVAEGRTSADERTRPRGRAIVRGGKEIANRSLDLLAAMLNFAVSRSLRADNPASGIRKFQQKKHDRYLTSEEMTRLGRALAEAEIEGANAVAVAAIRFIALTGCRKSEALTLRWEWLDLDRGLAHLPDSKTGKKTVLLGQPAVELLRDVPRAYSSPFVFPASRGTGHLIGLQKVWNRIRAVAGLDDVRVHDLRHNFASVGASGGHSLYLVGKLLGHRQAHSTERYAHLADNPVQAAATMIAGQIRDALIQPKNSLASRNSPGRSDV